MKLRGHFNYVLFTMIFSFKYFKKLKETVRGYNSAYLEKQ
jgi:hypothetical protein